MKFPVVKVKSIEDVDNHVCVRVDNIRVCTCIFEFKCRCGNIIRTQSVWGVKRQLIYGCHSCCLKKNKVSIKKNLNPFHQNDPKTYKATGNIGEHVVAKELMSRGYKVYIGYTTNEEGADLVIRKGNKYLEIQVKSTDIDHNDYINYNGNSCCAMHPSEVDFDFLIAVMPTYNAFWIVPVKDFKEKFLSPNDFKPKEEWKCNFKMNWTHKNFKKDRKFPYQDAWHLISDVFK